MIKLGLSKLNKVFLCSKGRDNMFRQQTHTTTHTGSSSKEKPAFTHTVKHSLPSQQVQVTH